jgi:hypothetical protein
MYGYSLTTFSNPLLRLFEVPVDDDRLVGTLFHHFRRSEWYQVVNSGIRVRVGGDMDPAVGYGVVKSCITRFYTDAAASDAPWHQRLLIPAGDHFVFNPLLDEIGVNVILKSVLMMLSVGGSLPNIVHWTVWRYIFFGIYPEPDDVAPLLGLAAPVFDGDADAVSYAIAHGALIPGVSDVTFLFPDDYLTMTRQQQKAHLRKYAKACILSRTVLELRGLWCVLAAPNDTYENFTFERAVAAGVICCQLHAYVTVPQLVLDLRGGSGSQRMIFLRHLRAWLRSTFIHHPEDHGYFLWYCTGMRSTVARLGISLSYCLPKEGPLVPLPATCVLPNPANYHETDNRSGNEFESTLLRMWAAEDDCAAVRALHAIAPVPDVRMARCDPELGPGDFANWSPQAHTCGNFVVWPFVEEQDVFNVLLNSVIDNHKMQEQFGVL